MECVEGNKLNSIRNTFTVLKAFHPSSKQYAGGARGCPQKGTYLGVEKALTNRGVNRVPGQPCLKRGVKGFDSRAGERPVDCRRRRYDPETQQAIHRLCRTLWAVPPNRGHSIQQYNGSLCAVQDASA